MQIISVQTEQTISATPKVLEMAQRATGLMPLAVNGEMTFVTSTLYFAVVAINAAQQLAEDLKA